MGESSYYAKDVAQETVLKSHAQGYVGACREMTVVERLEYQIKVKAVEISKLVTMIDKIKFLSNEEAKSVLEVAEYLK